MPLPKPIKGDQQGLSKCLGRMEQVEKVLYTALRDIVDTRQEISEMLQGVPVGDLAHLSKFDEAGSVCSAQEFPSAQFSKSAGFGHSGDQPAGNGNFVGFDAPVQNSMNPRVSNRSVAPSVGESVRALTNLRLSANSTDSQPRPSRPAFAKASVISHAINNVFTCDETSVHECAIEAGKKLGLSKDDIVKAYEAFCEHDTEVSGMLTATEAQSLLRQLTKTTLSSAETLKIFKEVDVDKNNMLDFSEFLMCLCRTPENRAKYLDAAATNRDSLMTQRFTLRMVGLPYSTLHGFIQKEIEEMTAFLSIPIIFLLFFCFVLSSHLHREVSILSSFQESIRVDIETNANFGFSGIAPFENGREGFKNLYDIQAIEDFWSWMDLGLMPLFFPAGWSSSEARSNVAQYCTSPIDSMVDNGWNSKLFTGNADQYADQKAFYLDSVLCSMNSMPEGFPQSLESLAEYANETKKPYRFFNEVISGVRMQQEQLSQRTCPRPDFKGHVYTTPCFEDNSWTWLKPNRDTALNMQGDLVGRSGGKTVYLKSATSLSEVKALLQELENERWFNPMTSKIQILHPSYNNHMDLFCATYVNIFLSRAGNIHKVVEPVCIWLDPYRNKAVWVTDFIMMLLVLKLCLEEAVDMVLDVKKFGLQRGCRNYFHSAKNIIDWASILFSIVIFILWLVWCIKVSDFVDLLGTARADVTGSWSSSGDIFTPSHETFWDDVDGLVHYSQIVEYVFAFYPFVIGARLFCTFGSQPRLGLVTATLTHAAQDIIHFLVVLLVVMLMFCTSADLLFGIQIPEYENFGRTFMSVFRAMLGDFDFVELTEVGRLPAAIWYLGFMVLVNMIMLNMLLAIIMDVYSTLKAGMDEHEETIWSQTWEIWDRWRRVRHGTEKPLKKVLQGLHDHRELSSITYDEGAASMTATNSFQSSYEPETKQITIPVFMEMVPGLEEQQAEKIMTMAHDWWQAQHTEVVTPLELQAMVRMIDLKLERAQAGIDSIEQRQIQRHYIDEDYEEA